MKKYKILVVFLLIIAAFIFNISTVNAEKEVPTCSDDLNNDCYALIFGIDMVKWDTDSDKVTIRVAKNYEYPDGKKVVFKAKTINGAAVSSNYSVSYGNDVEIPVSLSNDSMIIEFETTKGVTVVGGTEKKTGKVKATVLIEKDETYPEVYLNEDLGGDIPDPVFQRDEIDCTKYDHNYGWYDDRLASFEQKFCYIKDQAKKAGRDYYFDGKGNEIKDKKFSMKCKSQAEKISILYSDKMSDDELKKYDAQYYQNTNYYFASFEENIDLNSHYTYNYYPGGTKTSKKLQCKVKCQEAVIVEYGPPVAVKAGTCFQYKVKVTSKVSCNMLDVPEKPKKPRQACLPSPTCYHGSATYRQGGPNEEYDKCIQECDNGKYTTKCSNKCYEAVYGKEVDELLQYRKIANESDPREVCARASEDGGCYYKNKNNGKIYWYGLSKESTTRSQREKWNETGGGREDFAPGRWYRKFDKWGKAGKQNYIVPQKDGFYRRNYGSDYCHDSCHWEGCSREDDYLNPGYARPDYDKNTLIYQQALEECSSKATCSSTLSTFEFSTKYSRATDEKGNEETITVHFPYELSTSKTLDLDKDNPHPDYLSTCKGKAKNDSSYISTAGNAKSTILQYAGCYARECPGKTEYMTEWSFPGSWVNRKTGEITFVPQTESDIWRSKPDKFCVPRDAKSVNSLWYQWYYHQVEKVNTPEYDKKCLTASATAVINNSEYTGDIKEYNILARTKDFGYFKWHFDIKCFYAIDNGDDASVHKQESSKDGENLKCDPTQYRVRTVTTTELFPSGKTTVSGTTEGREAGFNWTEKASLEKQDIPSSYKTNPTKTLSNVETKGNSIYSSDSEVDYHFRLLKSRDDIKKIRNYNSHLQSFDVYCGTVTEKIESATSPIGISVYSSSLFRSTTNATSQDKDGCSSINVNAIEADKLGIIGENNQ